MALTRTGFILLIVVIVLLVIYVFPIHIHTRQLVTPGLSREPGARSLGLSRLGGMTGGNEASVGVMNARLVSPHQMQGAAVPHEPVAMHGMMSPQSSLSSYLWRTSADAVSRLPHARSAPSSVTRACDVLHGARALSLASYRAGLAGRGGVLERALLDESSRVAADAQRMFVQNRGVLSDMVVQCDNVAPTDSPYAKFHTRVAELLHPVYSLVAALPRAALRAQTGPRADRLADFVDAFDRTQAVAVDRNIAHSVFREAVEHEAAYGNAV